MIRVGIFLGCLLFLLGFVSCGSDANTLFEEYRAIPKNSWSKSDSCVFLVPVEDTLVKHKFFVNIRNTGNYAYTNLFLFVQTTFPNGGRRQDTLEMFLANPYTGEWLGNGSGSLYNLPVLFDQNKAFPLRGTYEYKIIHGMREDELKEITDIGLHIIKTP